MIMEGGDTGKAVQDGAVPIDLWKRLFETAAKVRNMEPWLWMEETDIFGVQDPESDTVLFVSVMGLLGEYHAVALYLGAREVTQFWKMQEMLDQEEIAYTMMGIRQIQAAFGKKSELDPMEKQVVRKLGMNFKKAHGWPYFRGYRPGWLPWVVDAQEARWALLALEQLLDVALRVKENRRLVARKPGTCTYLVRVSVPDGDANVWRDEYRECYPPQMTFHVTVPNRLLDAVRALKSVDLTIELDVAPSSFPIGKQGERPQLPYLLMAVDSKTFFILGTELLPVEDCIDDMWVKVPAKFLEMLIRSGIRPSAIAIRTPMVFTIMEGLCKDLGIEIKPDPGLPALTEARRDIETTLFNRKE